MPPFFGSRPHPSPSKPAGGLVGQAPAGGRCQKGCCVWAELRSPVPSALCLTNGRTGAVPGDTPCPQIPCVPTGVPTETSVLSQAWSAHQQAMSSGRGMQPSPWAFVSALHDRLKMWHKPSWAPNSYTIDSVDSVHLLIPSLISQL